MKTQTSNAISPDFNTLTPGAATDLYLEIESQGQENWRMPVQVKDLAAAGIILEIADLPPGLKGESLLHHKAVLHVVPDGLTKETQLRSQVAWVRQEELSPTNFIVGLDLKEADFRDRRSLESLIARPKDISDLWTYWDQVQTKPTFHNNRIIFYMGIGAFLSGLALKVALPASQNTLAMLLTLSGIYVIAGKCLWNWWRGRSIPGKS